jgi:hypothetical protein
MIYCYLVGKDHKNCQVRSGSGPIRKTLAFRIGNLDLLISGSVINLIGSDTLMRTV